MFYLVDMCCFCLSSLNTPFGKLQSKSEDDMTYFEKISAVFLQLSTAVEVDKDFLLCKKCCTTVDIMYKFNEMCLRNIKTLCSYKATLKGNKAKKQCNLSVLLSKMQHLQVDQMIFKEVDKLMNSSFKDDANKQDLVSDEEFDTLGSTEPLFISTEIKKEVDEVSTSEDDSVDELEVKIDIEEINIKQEYGTTIDEELSFGHPDRKVKTEDDDNILNLEHPTDDLIQQRVLDSIITNSLENEEVVERNKKKLGSEKEKILIQTFENERNNLESSSDDLIRSDLLVEDVILNIKKKNSVTLVVKRNNNRVRRKNKRTLIQETQKDESKQKYSCDVCNKKFGMKCTLNVHRQTHTGYKPFKCVECGKQFAQKGGLKLHMKIHTETRDFICDICKKGFTQKVTLERHKLIHSNQKPFSCNLCQKTFRYKSNLSTHKRIHTGNLYYCDVCPKSFTNKPHFDLHKLIHRKDKPFPCDMCSKQFTRKDRLNKHRLTHRDDQHDP